MSHDQVRAALDALRAKLQAEIEQQYTALEVERAEALAEARHEVTEEAERRFVDRVEALEADWAARLETERSSAREALDAEHVRVAELTAERDRLQRELEARAARVQEDLDAERTRLATVTIERDRLREELAAQKTAGQAAFESERRRADDLDRALEGARARLAARSAVVPAAVQQRASTAEIEITDARAAERESQLLIVERLLDATARMKDAQTLTSVLEALVDGVAATVPRVALFLVNGRTLQGWRARGFPDQESPLVVGAESGGVLADAMKATAPVNVDSTTAPPFAALAADRAGIAVPVIVGDRAVAVLYADDHGVDEPQAPASWPEAVQVLVSHSAACLAQITAMRAVQALQIPTRAATGMRGEETQPFPDEDHSARRYARLLVSEIKLYNENAVRVGREKRDLLTRLRPEIDRARRLYEERVSPSVGGRGAYFQQELVQTLADGDPALLGNSL